MYIIIYAYIYVDLHVYILYFISTKNLKLFYIDTVLKGIGYSGLDRFWACLDETSLSWKFKTLIFIMQVDLSLWTITISQTPPPSFLGAIAPKFFFDLIP